MVFTVNDLNRVDIELRVQTELGSPYYVTSLRLNEWESMPVRCRVRPTGIEVQSFELALPEPVFLEGVNVIRNAIKYMYRTKFTAEDYISPVGLTELPEALYKALGLDTKPEYVYRVRPLYVTACYGLHL